MCGIFGYIGKKIDASDKVLHGLKQLEYRGYDSWGVAVAVEQYSAGHIVTEKHVGKIGNATLGATDLASHMAIGHTRWATHGGVTERNAHPHLDRSQRIAVVHNGIIENFQELKTELLQKGYTFNSETDSEVFVLLVEEARKQLPLVEAVRHVFQRLHGLNAFVVMSEEDRQLVVVRKGSPLAIGRSDDGLYVASDASAMGLYANEVSYLEENEVVMLKHNGTEPADLNWQPLQFQAEDLSKGDYPHFLAKEIHEQPRVLSTIANELTAQIETYARHLVGRPLFVGCGTAYHAALSGVYFWSLIAGRAASAVPGSEFSYTRKTLTTDDFVSFISQSGETIDIVEHLPALREKRIPFGAIVNRLGSSLERGSDHKVLLPAGAEQCVLATKSYTAMVAVLFLLAHAQRHTLAEGKAALVQSISDIDDVLTADYRQRHIRPAAQLLKDAAHIFLIGRGNAYPIALEAALKIKEVTYVHTEGFAGGELKHGVIALIQQGTPCIVFAPEGDEYDATISNALELKVRGATIIGLSSKPNDAFDVFLPVNAHAELATLSHAVVMQQVAYEMALLLGNDPDKPRNLAKSVTVK
jgi:glucosamine--fructose-6-phosphate aminotransferase (isomerizing)